MFVIHLNGSDVQIEKTNLLRNPHIFHDSILNKHQLFLQGHLPKEAIPII